MADQTLYRRGIRSGWGPGEIRSLVAPGAARAATVSRSDRGDREELGGQVRQSENSSPPRGSAETVRRAGGESVAHLGRIDSSGGNGSVGYPGSGARPARCRGGGAAENARARGSKQDVPARSRRHTSPLSSLGHESGIRTLADCFGISRPRQWLNERGTATPAPERWGWNGLIGSDSTGSCRFHDGDAVAPDASASFTDTGAWPSCSEGLQPMNGQRRRT